MDKLIIVADLPPPNPDDESEFRAWRDVLHELQLQQSIDEKRKWIANNVILLESSTDEHLAAEVLSAFRERGVKYSIYLAKDCPPSGVKFYEDASS